jgi:hypothetical protein
VANSATAKVLAAAMTGLCVVGFVSFVMPDGTERGAIKFLGPPSLE